MLLKAVTEVILNDVLEWWIRLSEEEGQKKPVIITESGKRAVLFKGRSIEDLGEIYLRYFPRDAITKIICESDLFLQHIVEEFQDGVYEWKEGERETTLYSLTLFASQSLIAGMKSRIGDAIKAQYEEAMNLAVTRYYSDFLAQFGIEADVTRLLKRRGKEVVEKERERFASLASHLENVRLPARGRPRQWTRTKLEQRLLQAIGSYKKKNYGRKPTIAKAAAEMKMPVATLKSLLRRYDLKYSTYKKDA